MRLRLFRCDPGYDISLNSSHQFDHEVFWGCVERFTIYCVVAVLVTHDTITQYSVAYHRYRGSLGSSKVAKHILVNLRLLVNVANDFDTESRLNKSRLLISFVLLGPDRVRQYSYIFFAINSNQRVKLSSDRRMDLPLIRHSECVVFIKD